MDERIPLLDKDNAIIGYALVDAADAAKVVGHEWRVYKHKWHKSLYAYHWSWEGGERIRVYMHREILGLPFKHNGIDTHHDNGNGLDNRRANLVLAKPSSHMSAHSRARAQAQCSRPGSTSQYRGVYWRPDVSKWRAIARLDGQNYHLGYFANELEAARAASVWRAEHMPYSMDAMEVLTA